MSVAVIDRMSAPVAVLPPTPRMPSLAQGLAFAFGRRRFVQRLAKRHDSAFTLHLPLVGPLVFITDPQLAKQVFAFGPDDLGNVQPNLSELLGSRSLLGLEGAEHRERRKLLAPSFHGRKIRDYSQIIEEETLREIAGWPAGEAFPTFPSMTRITLNVILRTLLGAQGDDLDELRRVIPSFVALASRLTTLPVPPRTGGRFTPWGRLAVLRDQYEACLDRLIAAVQADPDFDNRSDMLSRLLRSRYEDGSALSRKDIGDEMLTLLAAGHETTAVTLSWAFERLSRHPAVLAAMADEADADGNRLRQATIREVQRSRPALPMVGRRVRSAGVDVGDWVLPQGSSIAVAIAQIHTDPRLHPNPERFDPQRFLGDSMPSNSWLPYGGGARRCLGSAFANLEMDIVLRTILRHYTIETTTLPGEKTNSRGLAFRPRDGGRIVVRRRAAVRQGAQ
ncbi:MULTISPECIES: cytochrome P450 [Mycolicibacter]|uniref:Cytochrome P450 n=1 Tax=[Mycobacterium] vasticus TaxID=2875777 RepID=A0ABU5YUX3_9MYCO|nr:MULTISPECIES: cytochrome P450 [unclassified Mycolicibacter]MEB3061532.1 cytochrome P450 [Mycolicibacter sp. MYC101]MEB3067789.1 cytochrome P450 [Mycolicibacter sp. MYC017]